MRFGRGRIIALTILSVTIALALFGASFFYNSRNFNPSASSDLVDLDPNYIPTFDDLYQRVPFGAADTGSILIGKKTKLTLLEESYKAGALRDFLNLNAVKTERDPYAVMQANRREGYPYPVFTDMEMRSIANGAGNNLQIPVVMLDPSHYDDVVLLELTELDDLLSINVKRDGQVVTDFVKGQSDYTVNETYTSDYVYTGLEKNVSGGKGGVIYAPGSTANSKIAILEMTYAPDQSGGYSLEIKDGKGYLYTDNGTQVRSVGNGVTALYDSDGHCLYNVKRVGYDVTVYDGADMTLSYPMTIYDAKDTLLENPLETLTFDPSTENLVTSYDIGAVAYNKNAVRGMFREQGMYEVVLSFGVLKNDMPTIVNISFAFIIVNKLNYINFPRFDTKNRVPGYTETYSYSYESEYPVINYSKLYFDVEIKKPAPLYFENNPAIYDERELRFYNIGEYEMISSLQYYSTYLYANRKALANRGVNSDGYISLNRYTKYDSVLNILGFQAYYGDATTVVTWQCSNCGYTFVGKEAPKVCPVCLHTLEYKETNYSNSHPFYDTADTAVSSDISSWLRDEVPEMTAKGSGVVLDFNHMSVGNALDYSDKLARFIDESGREPVRTNFPPVKLSSNVPHATGDGMYGETDPVVLSTVAFKAAYGAGTTSSWNSSTLEAGAPFTEAGKYVVVVYFRVNGEMCQQTFYFEIINSAKIAFEVVVDDQSKVFYGDDLVLNDDFEIEGNEVTIVYNGRKSLGKFEILPTFELKSYNFGEGEYRKKQTILQDDDGAFRFSLQEGRHILTVNYGVHNRAVNVFNIIVDKQLATGFKVNNINNNVLPSTGLPENVAVVGNGATSLTWSKKLSGVGFDKVIYEFYNLELEAPNTDPNYYQKNNNVVSPDDRLFNYDKFDQSIVNGVLPQLYSAYILGNRAAYSNDGYKVIPTVDGEGWTVSADGLVPLKFEQAGLYRLVIVDNVGNETPFVLIVDHSKPTFTQSSDNKPIGANIVRLKTDGIRVGFGKNKLIGRRDSAAFGDTIFKELTGLEKQYPAMLGQLSFEGAFNGLRDAGYLVSKNNRQVLNIPLKSIEISVAGGSYHEITSDDDALGGDPIANGYITLDREETYYFRATDALGNVGEFYIGLTSDACMGTVYAEDNMLDIVSLGNNSGRGMIEKSQTEPTNKTCIVTSTGGVTNRRYVTFSFVQSSGEAGHVDKVYLQYYPLTFDPKSSNYPFAERPLNDPVYKNELNETVHIFAHQIGDGGTGSGGVGRGLIYNSVDGQNGDKGVGTIRLALYNSESNIGTPAGMYIITRVYGRLDDEPGYATDCLGRDYYFIVDNQGMLTYHKNDSGYFVESFEGNKRTVTYQQYDPQSNTQVYYETPLTISFAEQKNDAKAKIANATSIYQNDKFLSSNRVAWFEGYHSKYKYSYTDQSTGIHYGRDSIEYTLGTSAEFSNYLAYRANDPLTPKTNFAFPALAPRFSYIHAGRTYDLGTGSEIEGELGSLDNGEDKIYQLIIADNARNISCELVDGNMVELKNNENDPTSANWDILTLYIDTECGTEADIRLSHEGGDPKVKTNSDMVYIGNSSYTYVVEPTRLTELQFSFEYQKSMYMDVDIDQTTGSWVWTNNGVAQQVELVPEIDANGVCTFDLMTILSGERIDDGASLSVRLITEDCKYTTYTILFDRYKPQYNLGLIKAGDNLARILKNAEIPSTYIYGLNNDFVFTIDQNTNQYLETKEISYREVDYSGEGSSDDVQFKLFTGADGEKRISFADLVGLRDNEMRYYWITEKDYVGHKVEYMVQLQGSDYDNKINFVGETRQECEMQIGIDMHASLSSVHQFFLQNNSFRFECGEDYYMVLDQKCTWRFGNEQGTDTTRSEDNLIRMLDAWIDKATQNGTKCLYTLYDRIGTVETFEFFNLKDGTEQLQLECKKPSTTSNVVELKVKNLASLPLIMFEEELAQFYTIEVIDITANNTPLPNATFALTGTEIPGKADHEFKITVTDPFGRVSMTEYHMQAQSTLDFIPYGKTVEDQETKIIYIGDERGVDFSYLRTVYSVSIYDASTNEPLKDLQSYISNDVISYNFKPVPDSNQLKLYRIIATGRVSGAVLFDQTFAFDTRLPIIQWKNTSDQIIDVDNRSFVSAVTLNIGQQLGGTSLTEGVNKVLNPFPVIVSYTRIHDGKIEEITFKRGTTTVTFDQLGSYEVTVCNTVWARRVFKFEIAEIDDSLVLVYDDGNQIQATGSNYHFTDDEGNLLSIPRYVFTKAKGQKENSTAWELHGLRVEAGKTGRVLVGNQDDETPYYAKDLLNGEDTLIWCLAFEIGTDGNGNVKYNNPLYIATTAVDMVDLNEENTAATTKISLKLNDDPKDPLDNSKEYTIQPANTTYDVVYNNFFATKDIGRSLTVGLHYNGFLMDSFGAPCYKVKGNLISVDCYYNGQFIRTMDYKDVFTIEQANAGYYEFVVHDAVGNILYFGDSSKSDKTLDSRRDRYMLAVMTRPIVTINGNQPVNNMIYNDRVELRLNDYGKDHFLNQYPQTLYENGKITKDEVDTFLDEYFKVVELEVIYNGESLGKLTPNKNGTVFSWDQSGKYNLTITYRIYGAGKISNDLKANYTFEIIPSLTVREEFNLPVLLDMPVIKLVRDGYTIYDYSNYVVRDDKNDQFLAFNANSNPGSYVVTLQTFDPIMQKYISHDLHFNIQHKGNSASSYFVLSTASGTGTTNPVTVYYNPYWLYLAQGEVTITLEKDAVVQEQIKIDASILNENNFDSQELFNVSEAGLYCVSVRNAEGNVVYSDSWTVEAKQSTFGYIVLSVVLGLAGIGILLFVRLRHRMTTK